MRRTTQHRGPRRAYLAILGGASLIALIAAAFATTLAGPSAAATTVAPNNTAEPRITGEPRVGQVQRANRGTWSGTTPISYEYRWFRCNGSGAADASDCTRISNASDNRYTARQADSGFRLRVQVIGRNADGQDTATSNPTPVISSAGPVNTDRAVDHWHTHCRQHPAGKPR